MCRTSRFCLGLSAACGFFLSLSAQAVWADVVLAGFENTLDTVIPDLPFHYDLTPDPPDATGPDILDTEYVCGGGAAAGVTHGNCALEINHPPDWGTDEYYFILSQGNETGSELELIDLIAESTSIQFDVTTFGDHNPQYRQIYFVLNTNYFEIGWYDNNADPDVQLDFDVATTEDEFFTTTVTLGLDAPLAEAGLDDGKTFYQALAQFIKADNEDGSPVDPVPTFQFFMVFQGADEPAVNPVQIVIDNMRLIGPEAPRTPGDYNNDGTVDAADYVVWRKNEGTTNALPNDPHGGTIGPLQFDTWRAHFGQTAGSGALPNTTVPEPASALLIIFAAALLCGRRPRIHSKVPSTRCPAAIQDAHYAHVASRPGSSERLATRGIAGRRRP